MEFSIKLDHFDLRSFISQMLNAKGLHIDPSMLVLDQIKEQIPKENTALKSFIRKVIEDLNRQRIENAHKVLNYP